MYLKLLLLTLFLLFLSATPSFAEGIVTLVRGQASILYPGKMKAVPVTQGAKILEQSSIVTKEKSLVRIKFDNQDQMIVGPSSMIVVTLMKKTGGNLISLINGNIRARIEKKEKRQFFVRTQTAALGVRGTDFNASFNAASYRTGLLTYDGSVAFKKIPARKRMFKSKIPENKKIKLLTKFVDKEPSMVELGDYSAVGVKSKTPSAPVKIAPEQYALLKNDTEMGVVKKDLDNNKVKKLIAEAEEQYKKKDPTYLEQQKTGGLVDLETGSYVPPTDAKSIKDLGELDSSGRYIPPKGLALDAVKGFVLKDKKDEQAQAKLEKLKQAVESQVEENTEDPGYGRYFQIA